MKLSAIILTLNEEKMIKDCLKSVKGLADEIIVVDSGSMDKTRQIAKKLGAKVYQKKLDSFAKQRNFGLKKAKGDWVLYLDADERISAVLREEIKNQISKSKNTNQKLKINKKKEIVAFYIARKNYFFGKHVKHGGYSPDYVTRLFKRKALIGWQGQIHESPKFKGKLGVLKNPIIHLSHRSVSEGLAKSIRWTKMEAELFYKNGHPPVAWWRLFRVFATEFFKRYLGLQGFRDGLVGFFEAWIQGFNRILVYVYLWEMQNKTKNQRPKIKNTYSKM